MEHFATSAAKSHSEAQVMQETFQVKFDDLGAKLSVNNDNIAKDKIASD